MFKKVWNYYMKNNTLQFISLGNQIGGTTDWWGPVVVSDEKIYMIKAKQSSQDVPVSRRLPIRGITGLVVGAINAALPYQPSKVAAVTIKYKDLHNITSHPDWPIKYDTLDDCDVMVYDREDVHIRKVFILNRAIVTLNDGQQYKVDHLPFSWLKKRSFLRAHGWLTSVGPAE